MRNLWVMVIFLAGTFLAQQAWGMEVYLSNGDKITGVATSEDTNYLVLKTAGDGKARINKSTIDRPKTYPEEYKDISAQKPATDNPVTWEKSLSMGYSRTGGNTRTDSGQLSARLNRKTSRNETTLKYDAIYGANNNKLNAKKFYGMARYANSFGKNLKWYNFYKIEGDQDRFTNINYRLIPSVGRGYWFSDTDDFKLMTELGIGYQYTNFRDGSKSTGETILTPRLFLDKRLIAKLHLTEDLTVYPSLTEIGDYRFRSETALINQISERWSGKVQLTEDYNSNPTGVSKKSDYTIMTSLEYKY